MLSEMLLAKRLAIYGFVCVLFVLNWCKLAAADRSLPKLAGETPRNIIFILADDHRFDAMGFAGHPFLETPNLDRMAKGGAWFPNTFVTTSLCSPSRASIVTGQYAHNHNVVDNYNPLPPGLIFFPEYMQQAGYDTAFVGKWHMGGNIDHAQPGYNHWVSFKGQGTYWPDGRGTSRKVPQNSYEGFNVNGKRVPQKGYITDELTDYALNWLRSRNLDSPFFLTVSHKAVHADFVPADRHKGRYKDKKLTLPKTFAKSGKSFRNKPRWLRDQRNSRHGVDFAYNLEGFDLNAYYIRYCETLLAVDENLGRIFDFLVERDLLDSTLLVYMGDNGFQFGEQGLIDKRTAYEASMRVPFLMHCPEVIRGGSVIKKVVANIDVGPTLLEASGLSTPKQMDGRSFWQLAKGKSIPWRDYVLYEYFWERNYPHTPTMHAVRGERFKYIRYHGLWDTDELYDLQNDPHETNNLIFELKHKETATKLNKRLFDLLAESGGTTLRLAPDRGPTFPKRHPDLSEASDFPVQFYGTSE